MHTARLVWIGLALFRTTAAPAGSGPLVFVANHGQAGPEVRFLAKTQRMNAYFSRREAVLQSGDATLHMEFVDATGPRRLEPAGAGSGVANFLIGPPDTWRTGVPLLAGV